MKPLSNEIRITVEDLSTGKKFGMVSSKSGDAAEFGEVVRRAVLEIQGCDFIAVNALREETC